jgi:hypothetical protein
MSAVSQRLSSKISEPFLPFAKPCLGEEEIEAVVSTLRSGWLTTGPVTQSFESKFSDFVGVPHAVAVNSATAGLHLALEAVGVGSGDIVLTTPFTFITLIHRSSLIRFAGRPVRRRSYRCISAGKPARWTTFSTLPGATASMSWRTPPTRCQLPTTASWLVR